MNATGKRRLLKLADLLDTVKPERFAILTWSSSQFDPKSCGTSACAVGWATTIPEFKAAGFGSVPGWPDYSSPARRVTLVGWAAVRHFFSLTKPQSIRLFYYKSYEDGCDVDPATVARRIRNTVKRAA